MSVSLTSTALQMQFSGSAGAWTDVSADTLMAAGISVAYGISGSGPQDRVAGTGTMTFALDNSVGNSGAVKGYYSPDHASVRSGFALGIGCRLALTYGGTTYYKFRGSLDRIAPAPGQYQSITTHCVAVDWMDEAAKTKLRGVAAQVSKRSDQIFSTVLAAVTRQPAATSVGTGRDTYPYALDSTRAEGITVLEELQRIAFSEAGFIYQKGNTTQGGTLVFESRTDRAAKNTALTTLSNTMMGMELQRTRSTVINRVQIATHPRTIDAAATTVLYSLQVGISQISLTPGQAVTIQAPYTDPTLRTTRVGGVSMVSPVATTDYTLNTASDGTGTDITSSLTVTATFGGDHAVLTLTNTHATSTGYVTKLQLRGKGIYDYQNTLAEARSTGSMDTYGERLLTYDPAYQSDGDVTDGMASYFLNTYVNPITFISSVSFLANRSDALMTAGLAREPGDRIAITETLSGLSTVGYFINSVKYDLVAGNNLYVTWGLSPASTQVFWLLGTVGSSEIGRTTTLGF